MFFTIKTLQQKTFKVELDDSENVKALKKKIEAEQGADFPADHMKLIYAGKILSDATPLSEYKIQETGFVVVMVSKPRPKPEEPPPTAPEQETATSGETSTPQTSTSEQEVSQQPQAQASITTTTTTTSATTATTSSTTTPILSAPQPPVTEPSSSAPSAGGGTESTDQGEHHYSEDASSVLVQGAEYEEVVSNLMSLGDFPREQVIRALHASFNNPERAAEYLITGIPDALFEQEAAAYEQEQQPEQGAPSQPPPPAPSGVQPPPSQQPPAGSAGGAAQQEGPVSQQQAPGEGQDPLEFLRNQPQFMRLRQVLQQNPQMLQGLLQQIGQSNPELLGIISQNQQRFIELINEPVSGSAGGGAGGGQPGQGGQLPQPPEGQGGPLGMPLNIRVTQQEKEAIDRLKAMGFPEHLVIQAYFACDKNEELAAEFLISQGPMDD